MPAPSAAAGSLAGTSALVHAPAPLPPGEQSRLRALHSYRILDTPPEPPFDDLALLAAMICGTPVALVSFVDEDRQWFKAMVGCTERQTSRDLSFCAHAILGDDLLVVPDTTLDPRFAANPLVAGEPRIRFYAGAPLRSPAGAALGTLCVIDYAPRELTAHQADALRVLARQVVHHMEMQGSVDTLADEVARRERAEASLYESEARTHAIVYTAADAIVTVDENGTIESVNAAAELLFGYDASELVGRNLALLVPRHLHADHTSFLHQMTHNSDAWLGGRREFEGRRKDGSSFPMDLTVSEAHVGGQRVFTGIARDLTERRRAQEAQLQMERRLQEGQKLESLGVLAGGIAHDFNNLLVPILGNAELAMSHAPAGSLLATYLEEIEAAAHQAASLAGQMLAYSGKGQFVISRIDLNALIGEMHNLLHAGLGRNSELRYELADALPLIDGDVSQVRQVILNLVLNASEAITDAGGVITVRTLLTGDVRSLGGVAQLEPDYGGAHVVLQVGDTGAGIDEAVRERIFEPFFTTRSAGRGLGLPATLGIVRGHGGGISVQSAPGRGATFTVAFPASVSAPQPAPPVPTSDIATGISGTILVVDDEESVRNVAARALRHAGFSVLTAKDGHEAVQCFDEHAAEITCVLMDMTMPRMGGEASLSRIRSLRPNAPVVMTSGYSERSITLPAERGLAFLQKPFTIDQLIATVCEAIAAV